MVKERRRVGFESASPVSDRDAILALEPSIFSIVGTTYTTYLPFGYHRKEESRFVSPGIGGTVIGWSGTAVTVE